MTRRGPRPSLIALAVLASACGDAQRLVEAPTLWTEDSMPRAVTEVAWDTLWELGSVDDTLLQQVRAMRADDDGLVLFDGYRQQFTGLAPSGEILWTAGREGEGPGEFTQVRDFQLGPGGVIYAVDPALGRVTLISRNTGDRVGEVFLGDGILRPEGIAPLSDATFVLATFHARAPFVHVSPTGEVLARFIGSWPAFPTLEPVARQGVVVSEGDAWSYHFALGDGWLPFEGTTPLGYIGRNVEHTDFPDVAVFRSGRTTSRRLLSRPVCSACSVWLEGGRLSVHFGGASEEAFAVVDQYAWDTGRYLGSYRLPGPFQDVVGHGDIVYAATEDPFPRLLAFRRRLP